MLHFVYSTIDVERQEKKESIRKSKLFTFFIFVFGHGSNHTLNEFAYLSKPNVYTFNLVMYASGSLGTVDGG